MRLLLEKFNFFLKSSFSTESLCPRVGVGVPQKKQGLRIPGQKWKIL